MGVDREMFDPLLNQLVELPVPQAKMTDDFMLNGEITFSDRFGNLATNINMELLELVQKLSGKNRPYIAVQKLRIKGITTHYAEGKGPLALVNSWGFLEIYLPMESAREKLGINVGDSVWVSFA